MSISVLLPVRLYSAWISRTWRHSLKPLFIVGQKNPKDETKPKNPTKTHTKQTKPKTNKQKQNPKNKQTKKTLQKGPPLPEPQVPDLQASGQIDKLRMFRLRAPTRSELVPHLFYFLSLKTECPWLTPSRREAS